MNIKDIRAEYTKAQLSKKTVDPNPYKQFENWFNHAIELNIQHVNAMTLATATQKGDPSARIVLLKGFDKNGFVFFTNYNSRKGKELELNSKAALLIYWSELEQQIRIEGNVSKVKRDESDEYFKSRPLESKISAVVSNQSTVVLDRDHLEEKWIDFLKNNYEQEIPRPDFWGGYRLVPNQIEFWQGRTNRLHDRILFKNTKKGWEINRLEP